MDKIDTKKVKVLLHKPGKNPAEIRWCHCKVLCQDSPYVRKART